MILIPNDTNTPKPPRNENYIKIQFIAIMSGFLFNFKALKLKDFYPCLSLSNTDTDNSIDSSDLSIPILGIGGKSIGE